MLLAFRFNPTVICYSSSDTFFSEITLGTDLDGSSGYNDGLDVPSPPPPPSGFYAYFPLDDNDFPFIHELRVDIRSSFNTVSTWELCISGSNCDSVKMIWDTSELDSLTESGLWIGESPYNHYPDDFFGMSEMREFPIFLNSQLFILLLPDTLPFTEAKGHIQVTSVDTTDFQIIYAYNPTSMFNPITSSSVPASRTVLFELTPQNYVIIGADSSFSNPVIASYFKDLTNSQFLFPLPGETLSVAFKDTLEYDYSEEISGRVIDEEGEGIPYALVFAEEARINYLRPLFRFTVSDSQGNFNLQGLSTRGVQMWGYQAGYIPFYIDTSYNWEVSETLYVSSVEEPVELVLRRHDSLSICGFTGRVVGPLGINFPVEGARVYALNEADYIVTSTLAGDQGEFYLTGLEPGLYQCIIDAYPYIPYISGEITLDDVNPVKNLGIIRLSRASDVGEAEHYPNSMQLEIYPNPFNSRVYIGGEIFPSYIEIINLRGVTVDSFKANNPTIWEPSADLPSGMYIINARNNKKSASKKVILLR